MNPLSIGLLVFACVFGAALLGLLLRSALPEHHLNAETKDTVRISMGLIATMAALVLGLLVASARDTYDTERNEVTQMAAKIAFLDRVLLNYGPESLPARQILRQAVSAAVARVWSEGESGLAPASPSATMGEALPKAIQKLTPQDDAQRVFKAQAAAVIAELGQLRWLLFEQVGAPLCTSLLIGVVVWLAIIFGSVGLFAPWNSTVLTALLLAALSVSGAIFLILELDEPFTGLIKISGQPMLNALSQLVK